MSNKKFLIENGGNLIVGAILIFCILGDLRMPELDNLSNSVGGLVLVGCVVLATFGAFHPFVGILALALMIKVVIGNRQPAKMDLPKPNISESMQSNSEPKTFQSEATGSASPLPDTPSSTLEQEVISNMAPLSSNGGGYDDAGVSPVMADSQGSNLNE